MPAVDKARVFLYYYSRRQKLLAHASGSKKIDVLARC